MKQILLMIAVVALVGCGSANYQASGPRMIQRPPFPVSEYEKLNKTGTATITGQVFMTTRGGDVKYGAGETVRLNPKTSYSDFWYQTGKRYINGENITLAPTDSRQRDYSFMTQADGEGRFTFEDIPDGRYYIASRVFWEVPNEYGMGVQGSWLCRQVEVKNGKSIKNVIINKFY